MRYAAGERRKESPADRARRVGEWERRQQRQREPLLEVPDAFDFKIAGEETVDGEPVYVIGAAPKPGYRPRSSTGAYLTKMKARFWIAKKDFACLEMEAETLDTISIGGILVRLAKGGNLSMAQGRVEDGLCLPKHYAIHASARVALIKVIRTDVDYTLDSFRRSPGAALAVVRRGTIPATMNTKIVVRRIGVVSMAKMMGVIYSMLGLIVGTVYSLIAVTGEALGSPIGSSSRIIENMMGIGAIILFPIISGIVGVHTRACSPVRSTTWRPASWAALQSRECRRTSDRLHGNLHIPVSAKVETTVPATSAWSRFRCVLGAGIVRKRLRGIELPVARWGGRIGHPGRRYTIADAPADGTGRLRKDHHRAR